MRTAPRLSPKEKSDLAVSLNKSTRETASPIFSLVFHTRRLREYTLFLTSKDIHLEEGYGLSVTLPVFPNEKPTAALRLICPILVKLSLFARGIMRRVSLVGLLTGQERLNFKGGHFTGGAFNIARSGRKEREVGREWKKGKQSVRPSLVAV